MLGAQLIACSNIRLCIHIACSFYVKYISRSMIISFPLLGEAKMASATYRGMHRSLHLLSVSLLLLQCARLCWLQPVNALQSAHWYHSGQPTFAPHIVTYDSLHCTRAWSAKVCFQLYCTTLHNMLFVYHKGTVSKSLLPMDCWMLPSFYLPLWQSLSARHCDNLKLRPMLHSVANRCIIWLDSIAVPLFSNPNYSETSKLVYIW